MERSVPPPGCFQHKQPILETHNSIARVPKNLTAYETQMSFTCQGPYLPALCVEDMWESEVNISGCSSGSFHFLFNIASHWPSVSSGRLGLLVREPPGVHTSLEPIIPLLRLQGLITLSIFFFFFIRALGLELWSLCLWSKLFTDWAASLACFGALRGRRRCFAGLLSLFHFE